MKHPTRSTLQRALTTTLLLVTTSACDTFPEDDRQEALVELNPESTALALDIEVIDGPDVSAPPVYIQIKKCTTPTSEAEHMEIDCRVDPEYALVGGGATATADPDYAHWALELTPFLIESRPLDSRTWRASSSDHLLSSLHTLTVYAIGMRLEGVNTQVLRDAIRWKEVHLNGDDAAVQVDNGWRLISGGAKTTPDTALDERFLIGTHFTAYHEWRGSSTDHLLPAPGSTSVWILEIEDKIIEGFGALEFRQLAAHTDHVDYGFSTSSVDIEDGWALVGMGGSVIADPMGAARMLVSVAPGEDGRSVSATSRDLIDTGAGTTQAFAVMARKVAGSRGLCNPEAGHSLQSYMDTCVRDICQIRGSCCDLRWDDTCVAMVESVCGRSCDAHTCVPSVFEPEKWNYNFGTEDNPVYQSSLSLENVISNCHYYAYNRYPDIANSMGMGPGTSLNLLETDNATDLFELSKGAGLIPVTFDEPCKDNRTKIYSLISGRYNHSMRQDVNGLWSEKIFGKGEAKIVEDKGVRPYVDVQNAPYEQFFCSCNIPLPDRDDVPNQEIEIETMDDDTAAPVHVQIKTCRTTVVSDAQQVDCTVDPRYVLVGGGATIRPKYEDDYGAYISESRPLDKHTWRAASDGRAWHQFAAYAIGLRLDGVSPERLADAISIQHIETDGFSAALGVDSGLTLIGGGAKTSLLDESPHYRVLTATMPTDAEGWQANAVAERFQSVDGTTAAWVILLDTLTFDGFGTLEIKPLSSGRQFAEGYVGRADINIEDGWALIGLGGVAHIFDSGDTGRKLVSVAPVEGGRRVNVTTYMHYATDTEAMAFQARRRP